MAKISAKKRSKLISTSQLTPPRDFDNKKYSGRWVAEQKLNARSDGYEPRGFEVWKTPDGNSVRVGDVVWCYMPKDLAEERKAAVYEEAQSQIESMKTDMAAAEDRLNYELRQAGGYSNTDIKTN